MYENKSYTVHMQVLLHVLFFLITAYGATASITNHCVLELFSVLRLGNIVVYFA